MRPARSSKCNGRPEAAAAGNAVLTAGEGYFFLPPFFLVAFFAAPFFTAFFFAMCSLRSR